MANIPDHIMHLHILPKLPVKSLIRFKCVSKSWLTLITSPNFIRLHHRHALSSDKNRHLICTIQHPSTYFDVYNLDSPLDLPSKCSYPKLKTLNSDVKAPIIASCEFFLLLRILNELVLVNPSTRSYHEISCQNLTTYENSSVKYGLCFDEANDDHKVIRITSYFDHRNRNTMEVMIYRFKTNSWRLIGRKLTSDKFYDYHGSNDVFVVNKLLYTILTTTISNVKKYVRIGCFDIEAEQWTNDIPMPENDLQGYNLRLLDGLICVLVREKQNPDAHCVWVMKDRWVKLMSIDTKNCWHGDPELHPITYRTGSRDELLCVRRKDYLLCWYNLRYKVATYAEFIYKEDSIYARNEYIIEHVCKGSLVTFANILPLPSQEIESWLFPTISLVPLIGLF